MDYSLPRSSVHGIFQVRVLEWVAISFSRGSSYHDGVVTQLEPDILEYEVKWALDKWALL